MNQELVTQLILALALAIIGLLGYAGRALVQVGIAYLTTKLGQTNFQRLRDFAGTVVRAVEQSPIYSDLAGEKKKELAIVAVMQFAEKYKLPIDRADIDKFIEAAVQEMNAQIEKIDWDMIAAPAEIEA